MTTTAGRIRPLGWRPLRHFTERSLLGLLVVLAAGAGFGLLLTLVRFRVGALYEADSGVAQAANDLVAPHPPVVTVLEAIARLGGRPVLLWLVTVAVVLLMVRRRTRLALYLTVAGLGALFLDPSLKALVGRLRPVVDVPVAAAPGNSFPSGHALGSMVAYGALLLVFLPAVRRRWRPLAVGLVALVVLAVGATRVMLGVHFVSDVLGGWLLGAAWVGVTAHAFRVWRVEAGGAPVAVLDGLEPEAADDIAPAPEEGRVVPHPWAGVAEILVGWVLVFGTLYAFGMLVSYRLTDTWVDTVDMGVSRWFAAERTPALDEVSFAWSRAGDTHAILLVSLVFCPLAIAFWRRWRPVVFLALTMAGELTLFLAASHAVGRPRPPVEQLDGQLPTSAFPSGHIAATMCLWVAIAVLVLPRLRHWTRWIFVALAVVMPVGVAVSRMYRGMHHPTDFVGAMLLTGLWIGLLYWVVRPNAETRTAVRS